MCGDYLFKQARGLDRRVLLAAALYALSGLPVWAVYRFATWMEVAVLWSVMAIVASVGVGVFILHERQSGLQWMALLLAMAAMVLYNQPVKELSAWPTDIKPSMKKKPTTGYLTDEDVQRIAAAIGKDAPVEQPKKKRGPRKKRRSRSI